MLTATGAGFVCVCGGRVSPRWEEDTGSKRPIWVKRRSLYETSVPWYFKELASARIWVPRVAVLPREPVWKRGGMRGCSVRTSGFSGRKWSPAGAGAATSAQHASGEGKALGQMQVSRLRVQQSSATLGSHSLTSAPFHPLARGVWFSSVLPNLWVCCCWARG